MSKLYYSLKLKNKQYSTDTFTSIEANNFTEALYKIVKKCKDNRINDLYYIAVRKVSESKISSRSKALRAINDESPGKRRHLKPEATRGKAPAIKLYSLGYLCDLYDFCYETMLQRIKSKRKSLVPTYIKPDSENNQAKYFFIEEDFVKQTLQDINSDDKIYKKLLKNLM